jgi:hypothetical protein
LSDFNAAADLETDPRARTDRDYWLVLSLVSLLGIAGTAFAEGFRLPGWEFFKPVVIWLVFPLQIVLLGVLGIQRIQRPSRKAVWAWLLLLVATLALCLGGFRFIEGLGRRLVQWEVSTVALANDCLQVIEEEGAAAGEERRRLLPPQKWPASIRRMRPMYVMVGTHHVRLELHGGFEHYGYTLERAAGQSGWVLEWYNEDANVHQPLITIPANR